MRVRAPPKEDAPPGSVAGRHPETIRLPIGSKRRKHHWKYKHMKTTPCSAGCQQEFLTICSAADKAADFIVRIVAWRRGQFETPRGVG